MSVQTKPDHQSLAPVGVDALVSRLFAVARYLREEADFNRSWADGRRNSEWFKDPSPEYVARRIELAEERETWAEAIESAVKIVGG